VVRALPPSIQEVVDRLFNKAYSLLNKRRRAYMRSSDEPKPEDDPDLTRTRNTLVLDQAREAGLLGGRKAARISGRIPAALLNAAKKRAHVSSDTELLELALSRLVLEDDFGRRFVRRKGKIPKSVDLEF
jgi:hypothetical protein